MNTLNSYFDHVYVINLKSREDRRVNIKKKLEGLNVDYELFDAVDGYSQENQKIYDAYLKMPIDHEQSPFYDKRNKIKNLFSPGAIGGLKSYEGILQDAIVKKYKRILVLEDDVIFRKKFNQEFHEFVLKLPFEDWKMLLLGASQNRWDEPGCLEFPKGLKGVYFPRRTHGSFAVGIDSSIYREIIGQLSPYYAAFDNGAQPFIYSKYFKKCFVAFPNLIIADVSTSDIRVNRNQYFFAHNARWEMELYDYP